MKKLLNRIPVIGYLLRLTSAIIFLPRNLFIIRHELVKLHKEINDIDAKTTASNEKILDILDILKQK